MGRTNPDMDSSLTRTIASPAFTTTECPAVLMASLSFDLTP